MLSEGCPSGVIVQRIVEVIQGLRSATVFSVGDAPRRGPGLGRRIHRVLRVFYWGLGIFLSVLCVLPAVGLQSAFPDIIEQAAPEDVDSIVYGGVFMLFFLAFVAWGLGPLPLRLANRMAIGWPRRVLILRGFGLPPPWLVQERGASLPPDYFVLALDDGNIPNLRVSSFTDETLSRLHLEVADAVATAIAALFIVFLVVILGVPDAVVEGLTVLLFLAVIGLTFYRLATPRPPPVYPLVESTDDLNRLRKDAVRLATLRGGLQASWRHAQTVPVVDRHWQDAVKVLAEECDAILLDLSLPSESMAWELDLCLNEHHHKLVVLVDESTRERSEFAILGSEAPTPVPDAPEAPFVLIYDDLSKHGLRRLSRSLRAALDHVTS